MPTEVKNVRDVAVDIEIGTIIQTVEPGDVIVLQNEALAEGLLAQPDNWGKPDDPTLGELLEEHVPAPEDEEAEDFTHELVGLTRTEVLAAVAPEPVAPPAPKKKADFQAALEGAGIEFADDLTVPELKELYEREVENAAGDGSATTTTTGDTGV